MGCFLACFGSSKDEKRRKQRRYNTVRPQDHNRVVSCKPMQSAVSTIQDESEKPINNPVSQLRDEPEKQLSLSTRKKVTFDSNVKTYEDVLDNEVSDFIPESELGGKKEKEKEKEEEEEEEEEESLGKFSQAKPSTEDNSVTSSSGSYPSNHRYQNCRDSDDEYEEIDCEDSDLDYDEDDDDDGDLEDDDIYEDDDDGIVESRRRICAAGVVTEEVDSPMLICSLREGGFKPIGSNPNARDRSVYVHPVLNPVENLSQWKAVKAKGTQPLRLQKENFISNHEPGVSFSSEPSFKELSFSFKSKGDQPKKSNQEIAVDASLSNWLVSSETTPINKTSTIGLNTISPGKSMSQGSNSFTSQEDRPILGALTVEELKQFSASSSPRKSPSRSPEEMPIIGTVGTYWSHTGPGAKGSGSASSYKGIPNTTSKYREDKKVNWHSTPFETRLERALNRGAAEA